MRLSWGIILFFHLIWFTVLFCNRKSDHPWLLLSFSGLTILDLFMFLFGRRDKGGLDLLYQLRDVEIGWVVWYGVLYALWIGWFCWLLFAAYRLKHGKTGFLIVFPILSCFYFLFFSLSGFGLFDPLWIRFVSRFFVEPILLLIVLYLLWGYSAKTIREGSHLDILALYLRLMTLCLGLRVLMALRPDLTMIRQISHACYYVSFAFFVVCYFIDKRVVAWLPRL